MRYLDSPMKIYLEALAAKRPAPGGGSVAALNAACAVSLVMMVVRYTLARCETSKSKARWRKILSRATKLQKALRLLIDEDAVAYLSGDVKKSIAVPARVCLFSGEVASMAATLYEKGNRRLASDAACAFSLVRVASLSALLVVETNCRTFKRKGTWEKKLLKRLKAAVLKIERTKQKVGGLRWLSS